MEFSVQAAFDPIAAATVNLDRFAEEVSLSSRQKYALDLIYEELMTNTAKYSFPVHAEDHSILVKLEIHDGICTFTMTHDGQPFDPWKQPDPDLDAAPDERSEGGIGIFLTKQFSKSVSYHYENGMNIISVTF